MATFALVHGGWHGAWCWELLTPLLEQGGHDVVAMDLPCDDGSADLTKYAGVVYDALEGRGDDVVLVGHSMGGLTIPLVAARRPALHLVYLCAVVPKIGRSLMDQVVEDPDMSTLSYLAALSEDADNRQSWVDLELTRSHLYADCDDAAADAAIERLRPQAVYPMHLEYPLAELPPVPSTYIVCRDDRMLTNSWSKRVAKDRLGAQLIELPGSHSPFLSRPRELAEVLCRVAAEP